MDINTDPKAISEPWTGHGHWQHPKRDIIMASGGKQVMDFFHTPFVNILIS